jgi:hypothetical protein
MKMVHAGNRLIHSLCSTAVALDASNMPGVVVEWRAAWAAQHAYVSQFCAVKAMLLGLLGMSAGSSPTAGH